MLLAQAHRIPDQRQLRLNLHAVAADDDWPLVDVRHAADGILLGAIFGRDAGDEMGKHELLHVGVARDFSGFDG